MQQYNISKGIKGFWRLYEYSVRWSSMINEHAQRRADIVQFWRKHGLRATTEAFNVSRRTLYNWQKKMRESNGHFAALEPGSRAPKRRRVWNQRIIDEMRRVRTEHPNIGKEKIHIFL